MSRVLTPSGRCCAYSQTASPVTAKLTSLLQRPGLARSADLRSESSERRVRQTLRVTPSLRAVCIGSPRGWLDRWSVIRRNTLGVS